MSVGRTQPSGTVNVTGGWKLTEVYVPADRAWSGGCVAGAWLAWGGGSGAPPHAATTRSRTNALRPRITLADLRGSTRT